MPTLIDLDPRALDVDANVCTDVGDVSDLTATVRALGVLQPLLVTPAGEDGRHQVIAGSRRRAAAIEAEVDTVPCVIVDAGEDAATAVAMGLVENLRRQDLTEGEEAAAYEQLHLAGWKQKDIAAATGTKPKRISLALKVASNDTAAAVAQRYDVTLDQAAAIGEFDDPETVKALTVLAVKDPGMFDHALSRARRDRDRQASYDQAVAALQEAGVAVVDDDDHAEAHQVVYLSSLTHDGEVLTAETHSDCPGHIATVSIGYDDDAHVTYGCTDPDTHGHQDRFAGSRTQPGQQGGPMSDEQKAERRTVIANNRAWRDAEPVRLAHVQNLLRRATPPKGTMRYVTTEILTSPEMVARASGSDVAAIVGRDDADEARPWERHAATDLAEQATDKRLPLVLLAQVAAAFEGAMSPHTWRSRSDVAARYLRFLVSTGYTLSEVEQIVVDLATDDEPAEALAA
jgi:ParB family chromosome partitioning protein